MLSMLLLFSILGVFLGIWIYVFFGMLKSIAALKWPSVTGKILDLQNIYESDPETAGRTELVAKYIYLVNEIEYFSKRLAFGYLGQEIDPLADRLYKKFK